MAAHNAKGVRRALRRGKTRWVLDFLWFDRSGRPHRYRRDARIQTRDGALLEAKSLQERALRTGTLDELPAVPTVRAFARGKFTEVFLPTYRPATRSRYLALLDQGLLAHFGDLRLDQIGPPNVHVFAANLAERGVSAKGPVVLLRTIARAAVKLGLLEAMPNIPHCWRPSRKLPSAPSREDVVRLLGAARGWLRIAIALAAFAGLRSGEVRALEVHDVDLVGRCINVRHALSDDEVTTPKSGHERIVPLGPLLEPLVVEAMKGKAPNARIVVTSRGTTPSRQAVLTRLNALEQKLGMTRWSFHQLRHHFCTSLLRGGATLETVRVLAGHGNVKVTGMYVHTTSAELTKAIERL